MVANMSGVPEMTDIPELLRQHVAKARLAEATDDEQRQMLKKYLPKKRLVSAGLTKNQSRQLIHAFYILLVERVREPLVARAAELIMYRYVVERGYVPRYMGKYQQDGLFVGNGDTFRQFARLSQYAPSRLPSEVLNKLCDGKGKLRGRGSKGSRSKYIDKSKRYKPKRRLASSHRDRRLMTASLEGESGVARA